MTGIVAVLWRSASDRCPTQKYAASLPDCSCKAPIDAIYIGQVIFARTLSGYVDHYNKVRLNSATGYINLRAVGGSIPAFDAAIS